MSTNALIGWSGFIGQEILSQIEKNIDIYNSSNIETIRKNPLTQFIFADCLRKNGGSINNQKKISKMCSPFFRF